mgnify:CR=1 FL=1|jgi:hypothetical protein
MKKMRKKYVVPLVTKHIVELEEGVCATGSFVKDTSDVKAAEHADGQTSEYIDGVDNTFNTIEWK